MEKKVDPESCGQLQSAVFKQKEASALRISEFEGRKNKKRKINVRKFLMQIGLKANKNFAFRLKDVIHSSLIITAALERGSWTIDFEILA